jgi:hypothetical protein
MRVKLSDQLTENLVLAYAAEIFYERNEIENMPLPERIEKIERFTEQIIRELNSATITRVVDLLGERFFACVRHSDARRIGTQIRVDMIEKGTVTFSPRKRTKRKATK